MPTNVTLNQGAVDLNAGASYSGGILPVNGDSLFITAGGQYVNTNPAALTAVNLARVFHSAGFTGSMGSAGAPIEFGNVTTFDIDGKGGQHYYKTGTTTLLRVAGSGGGKVWFSGGTFTTVVVYRGEVEFSGACSIGRIIVMGGNVIIRKATTGAATTKIVVRGGKVTNERTAATIEVVRATGTLLQMYDAAVTTLLRVIDGVVQYKSSGTITYLEGAGGVLTTKGAEKTFTVTDGELWEGFSIDDSTDLQYLEWATQPDLFGYKGGGALKV